MGNEINSQTQASPKRSWFIYLIKCKGNRLYTGITTNLNDRFNKHLTGRGAAFTRSFPPIKMLAAHPYLNRSEATKAEIAMKKLRPKQKLKAIENWQIKTNLPKANQP